MSRADGAREGARRDEREGASERTNERLVSRERERTHASATWQGVPPIPIGAQSIAGRNGSVVRVVVWLSDDNRLHLQVSLHTGSL